MEKLRKKWYIPAAAVAIFAVMIVAVMAFRGSAETYRSIRIVEMEGGVTIERDGVGSLEASVNMNLISNDYVRTDADSYVVLRLDDDKYVMLGEQGAMQVQAEGSAESGRTAIHLEKGSVLSEIQNPLGQDASYEIITPSATMSVRGTVFEARKAPDGNSFELLVYEGKVAVGLGNLEPVLYTGGEYTQFTAGDTPRFLVERDVITEERMNDQMLERLQQIEENGRALEFGEVQLDVLIEERSSSEGRMEVADNSQTRKPAASAEAPDTTAPAAQIPTEAPAFSPTASPEPAATKRPVVTAAPVVTVPPSATVTPEWEPEPEPEWEPDPTVTTGPVFPPVSGESPKPSNTSRPTKEPASTETPAERPDYVNGKEWWTRADGKGIEGTEIGSDGWKVVYFMPGIADILIEDGVTKALIDNQEPRGFARETINEKGALLQQYETIPDAVSVTIKNNAGEGSGEETKNLEFAGWYYEAGEDQWEKWDPEEAPQSDLWLYAVWKEKVDNKDTAGDVVDSNEANAADKDDDAEYLYYYPKIWRDSVKDFYRCYSVREDIEQCFDKQTMSQINGSY